LIFCVINKNIIAFRTAIVDASKITRLEVHSRGVRQRAAVNAQTRIPWIVCHQHSPRDRDFLIESNPCQRVPRAIIITTFARLSARIFRTGRRARRLHTSPCRCVETREWEEWPVANCILSNFVADGTQGEPESENRHVLVTNESTLLALFCTQNLSPPMPEYIFISF